MGDEKATAMLIVATKMATPATTDRIPIRKVSPITMIPLIALVTLISGVCREGVTLQTTMYSTKQERTKTVI